MNIKNVTIPKNLILLVTVSVCAFSACSEAHSSRVSKSEITSGKVVFGLYTLRSTADALHTILVHDKENAEWYRGQEAAFGIECVAPSHVSWTFDGDGNHGITIVLHNDCTSSVASWTTSRLGQPACFVLDRRILAIATIETTLGNVLLIPGFSSQAEAERTSQLIREAVARAQANPLNE